jgi:hypothetical protein
MTSLSALVSATYFRSAIWRPSAGRFTAFEHEAILGKAGQLCDEADFGASPIAALFMGGLNFSARLPPLPSGSIILSLESWENRIGRR